MKTFYLSTAKLKSLLVLAFLTASTASFAAWDIWQAYVITNVNGGGNTYQQAGLDGTDPTVSFVNRYYGRFSSGQSLVMAGGELKSYKNGSSNVCGATLFYRVYRTCDTPGSFNSAALAFSCNYPCTGLNSAGDQKWSTSSGSTNLLSGLTTSGTYVIEAYWMLEGNTTSTSGCGEFKYASLSSVNYRAYFEYEVTESFSDGNFTSSPTWSGDASNWTIATKSDAGGLTGAEATQSSTLRLNSTAAVGTEYLSTSYTAWNSQQEWYFFVGRRNQSATAANQTIVWLYANEATLESGTVDGYRIVIGDDAGNDEIMLQRVDNGVGVTIFTTSASITNNIVDWGVTFKITRRSNGRWVINTSTLPTSTGAGATALSCPDALSTVTHTDATSGLAYVVENTYAPSVSGTGYFGVVATHGSASAETSAMEFDNLRIVPLPPDTYVQVSGATSSTIAEDASGLVAIGVDILNPSATTATTVQLVLTSGSSGRFGGGLTTPSTYAPSYTTQTLTWAAGTSSTKYFYIDPDNNGVCDDNATIVLQLQSAGGGLNAYVGAVDTYTLTITDDNIGYLTLISDTFEDGNLNSPTPAWVPVATGSWTASTTTPITGTYSMRSVSTGSPGSNYISYDTDKASLYGQTNTWRFNLQYNLEPNPANKWLVFLAANEANLASSTVDGYAVGINPVSSGDPDILTLWKIVDGAPNSAICTSSLDWGIAQNIVGFEIERSTTGLWTFKIDSNGNFDALVTQGTPSTDNTYSDMGYFGVRNAFTASNGAKLALDDITFSQQGCREVYYSRQTGNWTDAIWSTSSNTGSAPWSSITPSRYTELVVQSGHTVTVNTSSVCNNLTIDNGGTVTGSSNSLTVFGNWTNNGTFTAQTGTIWLKGSAAQSITGAAATTFNNLIVDSDFGTVNVATANTTVKGLVSPEEGTLQCAGNLVLASDATSSGSIGEIKSGADVSGNLTLQRYIPAAIAGWVMLGCPILNSLTLADWDDDLTITGITGGTDGFNPPSYNFVNVQYYDETQQGGRNIGWVPATNITNQLTPSGIYTIHRGYNVYLQPNAQTVDVTGPIQKGGVTINLSYTLSTPANAGDGWNYITQPYPSEVDWVAVEANSSDIATYYVYDAQLPGYRSYNANSLVGNASPKIAHSQTILVKATTFGQTLNFLESHKTNTNAAFERDEVQNSMMVFRIEKDNQAGEATLAFVDGSTVNYESTYDAEYLESPVPSAPQIALVSADDSLLAISAVPHDIQNLTIPVYVKMPSAGSYLFSITQSQNIPFGSCLTIEDVVTGTTVPMESGQTITLTTDAAYTGYRLIIHVTSPVAVLTTNATCYGALTGSIEVTPQGGDWSYAVMNDMGTEVFSSTGSTLWPYVAAGHYLLTLENSQDGCGAFTQDLLISEPAPMSSWIEGGMALCNEASTGTIDIGLIGDSIFSYIIFNSQGAQIAQGGTTEASLSLANLPAGVYQAQVDYACGSELYTVDLNDPNAVNASITALVTQVEIPTGDSVLVSFTGNTNATDFSWSFAGNDMGNVNPLEVYVSNTGNYDVAFTATNGGCTQTAHQTLMATIIDNTNDINGTPVVSMQKTGQMIQLTFRNGFATASNVRIFNALGQLVHETRSNDMVQQIDLSNLSSGSYTVQVMNNGSILFKQTLVK